jgi:hypothetical protein
MRLIASEDFLYDTVDVAIWSSVEQGLAITAGCLATLQPLVKFIAFKLGLRPHPSLPTPNGYGNQKRMNEGAIISVRKSFTHKTELTTPGGQLTDKAGLNLQPGMSGYSAMCYNTSQELLAMPTRVSDGESAKDLEHGTGRRNERDGIPAAYIPHTHIASTARLSRFRSSDV